MIDDRTDVLTSEAKLFEENADAILGEVSELSSFAYSRPDESTVRLAADYVDIGQEVRSSSLKYRVVDLRGLFCDPDGSWGTNPKSLGVIQHYNGGEVPTRAWLDPIAWIKFITELHMQPNRFDWGWTFLGCAYHEFTFGFTVYRVMNWRANTPHCGNYNWNLGGLAQHIAVGGGQPPSMAGEGTMLTAMRRADDHLAAMGQDRHQYRGHRQVGASLCPGEPIMASLESYWGGADLGEQKEEPAAPQFWRGTRWDWCQDDQAPCPAILTWDGKDTWKVERVSSNPDRLRTMSRWDWCNDNNAPAPIVLTYDGGSAWKVTRI